MNCHYTDDELKAIVEDRIGIRAKEIEKIEFCGLWHVRFHAFGTDFYWYKADTDEIDHLKESPWRWNQSPCLTWLRRTCSGAGLQRDFHVIHQANKITVVVDRR